MFFLKKHEIARLRKEINVVIHCAASVGFTDPLVDAIKQNCLGTLELFELARSFERLDAFVHVSTAYVNSNLGEGKRKWIKKNNVFVFNF